jgi:chromosomal replication initiation ATPase DnaA
LLSRSRHRPIAAARQVAMYLCRNLAKDRADGSRSGAWASFPRIGMAFFRDHSSVIHAYNVVARRSAVDVRFAQLVEGLAEELRARPTAAMSRRYGKEMESGAR